MLKHWPQGLQNLVPKLDGILSFQPWGQYKTHKVRHLLVTMGGRLKIFYSISTLTPSVKALGADFNFCTNNGMLDLS
jgi:hypothetical protein